MADKTSSDSPPEYTASSEHNASTAKPPAPPLRKGPLPFNLPIINHMKSNRTILASASPRRRALLAQIGLTNLEIRASTKPENLSKDQLGSFEYVAATANQKCLDVYELAITAQRIEAEAGNEPDPDPELVIAADTIIVTRAGQILEKPRSEQDHIRMLKHLRDTRVHRVLTAVSVLAPKRDASHPGYEMKTHTEETKVFFASETSGLSDEAIESYVRTREGADKAGGYAIQGTGGLVLVEKIEGNFDNVVGLPVRKTLQLAEKVVFHQGEEEVASDEEEEED